MLKILSEMVDEKCCQCGCYLFNFKKGATTYNEDYFFKHKLSVADIVLNVLHVQLNYRNLKKSACRNSWSPGKFKAERRKENDKCSCNLLASVKFKK